MKSLLEFIKEAQSSESVEQTSKDITFNFTDIENGKDTVEKVQNLGTESGIPVAVDGQKVTISFSKDTFAQAEELINTIKDFINVEGKSTRRASSEQYAQKLHAFEDAVKKLDEFKADCDAMAEPEPAAKTDDDDKNDDKDKNDK